MNTLLYNKKGEKWSATSEEYEDVKKHNGWSRTFQSDGWSAAPPLNIRIRLIYNKFLKALKRR